MAEKSNTLSLGSVLIAAYTRLPPNLSKRVGLYLVALNDSHGFALAESIYKRVRGPSPTVLRERSKAIGAKEPLMVGSARVEMLAATLEKVFQGGELDGKLLGYTVRATHKTGEVPVVVVLEGWAIVTTLAGMKEPFQAPFLRSPMMSDLN
ncbi:MAG: hypothetical protein IPK82_06560 [Polyangiaceae bacterium]|nr:hypothetical protein [Polyangiaceae bacterium]